MDKLPLEESDREEIDRLLNDPDLTRQEIDEHLEDIHPHPLRPITEETLKAVMLSKHAFFNFCSFGFQTLAGLPEPIRKKLRQAALVHLFGNDRPETNHRKAQQFAHLLRQEAERFEEIAARNPSPG